MDFDSDIKLKIICYDLKIICIIIDSIILSKNEIIYLLVAIVWIFKNNYGKNYYFLF
jgi:hypothetical protein